MLFSFPIIYINGVNEAVTENTTPDTLHALQAGIGHIGANILASPFDGEISIIAIYSDEIGNKNCELITTDTTKIIFEDAGATDLIELWKLEEQPLGSITNNVYINYAPASGTTITIHDSATAVGETHLTD